jgi:hypothetical protein
MTEEARWNHFILNMGFVPFLYTENSAQETIDIAWIKIYQNDPTDLYIDSEFDGIEDDGDETADEATDEATEAPVGDATDASSEETTAPQGGDATEAPTDAPHENKGCGSVVGFGVTAVLMAAAAAVALKKKD